MTHDFGYLYDQSVWNKLSHPVVIYIGIQQVCLVAKEATYCGDIVSVEQRYVDHLLTTFYKAEGPRGTFVISIAPQDEYYVAGIATLSNMAILKGYKR